MASFSIEPNGRAQVSSACEEYACGNPSHWSRRSLLRIAGGAGLTWLTPLGELLARERIDGPTGTSAKHVILIWLEGGASQLETFDPQPTGGLGDGTTAIPTRLRGVQFAAGMERTAEWMDRIALIRNVVSREGDHERAVVCMKTGYRPEPTLVYPSLGAVIWHQSAAVAGDVPGHISIHPGKSYGRGGYLGAAFDAYRVERTDTAPKHTQPGVDDARWRRRIQDLAFVDGPRNPDPFVAQALRMMDSAQLHAFDVRQESPDTLASFGDTDFGRGCLAAVRLLEVGVPCVELTLPGWDSHLANKEVHDKQKRILDPALAALFAALQDRELWRHTLVLVGSEFGRTPRLNPAGGRDHWPHGFTVLMAGGDIRAGVIVGATDPAGGKVTVEQGTAIADIHATVLTALGVDPATELMTPVGRPVKLSTGNPIARLIA